ncbi:signal transduction histidine kinase [Kitasatospora sp. MAA4]|uniref:nitrate- and nitrite sensing domain-containing protein n=1 Tax=Kitasatospora sp. MAA4 TaxID=3035093 RepID=UPI002472EC38|nr:nitrate- and nitrite sensing domain-containing protein [Kitasatospora sp. MAA4]MDH6137966.1 signal transduction histidine kinase [Kitasatospora sp. MAA4]
MQGRFKRGSGAAGHPESHEPLTSPDQPAPDAVPGDQLINGAPEADSDAEESAGRLSRAKLRGSLTRRRATGLGRIRLRNWRIRTRLIALLLLPVVVAIVLGGLRVQTSMQNSSQLAQMANLSDLATRATALADALETERDISAGPITANGKPNDGVDAARKQTDDLNKAYNARADSFDGIDLSGGNSLLMQVRKDMMLLSNVRSTAYSQPDNIESTITSYDTMIKDLLSISQDIALASANPDLVKSTRALQQFSLEKESSSMTRALISAALARQGGASMSQSDQSFGIRLQTSYDNAVTNFNDIYGNTAAQKLRTRLSYNSEIAASNRYAQQVMQANGIQSADPRTYLDWYEQSSTLIDNERAIESQLLEELKGKAQSLQSAADTETILTGVLIALVLLVAVLGAALVARSMVRSLTKLQTAAEDVAERRLPELVKTLSESDPHDVDVTVDPVGVDSADEIGHVAHAFDMVHREAVRLAAEQALLRGNINAMFTNLSRRSQGLIQRQLSLISELESREADPDQLASLFKLDHLATRMRRNGENLLVLAGEDPGRRWTRPVPLVDVLRAAASEVEQYERIELAAVPSAEVAGRVVNDLVHLLAELLENATSFSSPQTRVRVTGHALPDGRVLVEIHDTGIGLSPDDLADINERLASPPTVDVSVSRRMGLFVVGRLSLRHGIRIQLRPSDSGGTTALVMLPVDVTNSGDRRAPRPTAGAAGKQQRGVGPTPRQQRPLAPGGEMPGGRPAPALGQGPGGAGPTAPGGRPQLPQGPQGPGAPGQQGPGPQGPRPGQGGPAQGGPAQGSPSGGLPTRAVGQSLRETPPGQPPRRGAERPGAPAGGPGLPRRGPQEQGPRSAPQGPRPGQERPRPGAELPGGRPDARGEQLQHGRPEQDGRPQGPGAQPGARPDELPQRQPRNPFERNQQPQGRRPAQGPGPGQGPAQGQGRPQGQPQGQGRPQGRPGQGAPMPRQQQPQGPGSQGPGSQGPDTMQQPVIGQGAPQGAPQTVPQAAQQAPQVAPPVPPVESTVQFARPRFEASEIDPRDPLGLGLVEPVLPSVASPAARPQAPQQPQQQFQAPQQAPQQYGQQQQMALPQRPQQAEHGAPQGGGAADDTQWFRTGGASRMASVQVNAPEPDGGQQPGQQQERPRSYQPQRPGTSAPGFTPEQAQEQARLHAQHQQAQQQSQQAQQAQPLDAGQPDAPWRPSANDERWRRAEQLREPTSSGVTMSGLPRRTPQANLVSGTAEAAPLTGPQVSRAPEEVRGRLTNLRRGIQQGRRAGAEATQGIPITPQQFDGSAPGSANDGQGDYRAQSPDGGFGNGSLGGNGFGTDNQER